MHYVLVCLKCGTGDYVITFPSPEERGKWAAEHTRGTGHEEWWVHDHPEGERVVYVNATGDEAQ